MRGTAAADSGLLTVTRTSSEPARHSSATCLTVPATSAVSVLVIDCTTTGWPPPTTTLPDAHREGGATRLRYRLAHCPAPLSAFGHQVVAQRPQQRVVAGVEQHVHAGQDLLDRQAPRRCRSTASRTTSIRVAPAVEAVRARGNAARRRHPAIPSPARGSARGRCRRRRARAGRPRRCAARSVRRQPTGRHRARSAASGPRRASSPGYSSASARVRPTSSPTRARIWLALSQAMR